MTTFVVDRSERGKLALTGAEAKDFLQGQVTNDILGLTPGRGCYAAFLTHKGKMLGDMRVFDLGDELLLDCERVALQELFNMIRRYKLGRDVELHKRTVRAGPAVGDRTGRAASWPAPDEHDNARVTLGGADGVAVRTDVGVDLFFAAGGNAAVRGALEFPDGDEAAGRDRARRARPPALRRRPRRQRDPPGGGPQRARGLVHQGLLRRPGDGRAAATTAASRTGACSGLRLSEPVEPGTELKLGEKVVGKLGSVVVSPEHGPIGLALVRREANPGDTVASTGRRHSSSTSPSRGRVDSGPTVRTRKGAAHGRSRDRARQPHRRGA